MAGKDKKARSVGQRIANHGRELGLDRADAFTAYVMDRFLRRLGQSGQSKEFILKGGVLVANLIDNPHRFTRDIDLLRRRGPAKPDDVRARFAAILAAPADHGIDFGPVRAVQSVREVDGYDGVKVRVTARVGKHPVELQVDIGFGDAAVPKPARLDLVPFLAGNAPARLMAYATHTVIAEKSETLLGKFPVIRHRLKDLLDVVALARATELDGATLTSAMTATFERRGTRPDTTTLDEMKMQMAGREWTRDWATMIREKRALAAPDLNEAIADFDRFVRPVLIGMTSGHALGTWQVSRGWEAEK